MAGGQIKTKSNPLFYMIYYDGHASIAIYKYNEIDDIYKCFYDTDSESTTLVGDVVCACVMPTITASKVRTFNNLPVLIKAYPEVAFS